MGKHKVTLDMAVQIMMDESAKVPAGGGHDSREPEWKKTIMEIVEHYAKHLELDAVSVFNALESSRTYWYANYYQWAKLPKLEGDVYVYETEKEMLDAVQPARGFRCPACKAVTPDSTECHSQVVKDGRVCNWKAYGLFGTMGEGVQILVKEDWMENPMVHSIFKPIALEESDGLVDEKSE